MAGIAGHRGQDPLAEETAETAPEQAQEHEGEEEQGKHVPQPVRHHGAQGLVVRSPLVPVGAGKGMFGDVAAADKLADARQDQVGQIADIDCIQYWQEPEGRVDGV